MSHLHFTSNEIYRKRVIQLGESPETVFNVGAIGLDSIKGLQLLSKEDLEKSMDFKFGVKNILVTFHPVTLENKTASDQFNELLRAISKLEDTKIIFTYPNSDRDGKVIIDLIDEFVFEKQKISVSFKSLGQLRYLSALKYVDLVIGNSSSGIIEVPYFSIPTVNIGDRQKGRLAPDSVINCKPVEKEISKAINLSYSNYFIDQIKNQTNYYGSGETSIEILARLKRIDKIETKKKFFDITK